jgi:hypothetical protein
MARRNLWPGIFALCLLGCGDDGDKPERSRPDGGAQGDGDGDGQSSGDGDSHGGDGDGADQDAGPLLDGSQVGSDAGDVDAGDGDGGLFQPPGTALSLPIEGLLITQAHPYQGSGGSTRATITSGRRYGAAYSSSTGELYSDLIVYRFVARTRQAPGEWPGNGVKVWWQRLEDGALHSYLCVRSDSTYDAWALKYGSVDDATGDPAGEPIELDYCSWTLVKHPTENKFAIRAAFDGTELEHGKYVTDLHASTAVANTVRVDGRANDLAAFFEVVAPPPSGAN